MGGVRRDRSPGPPSGGGLSAKRVGKGHKPGSDHGPRKAPPAPPKVSIILLAHNKAGYTERCLRGLSASAHRPLEIVAVDNGSTDSTPQLLDEQSGRLEGLGIEVQRLTFKENIGAVSGRNRAMERARGDYWVFLDNDVVPRSRRWVEELLAYLAAHPDVGAVAPKLVFPFAPFPIQCAGCEVSPTGKVSFLGRGEPRETPEFNCERECQALISACWMMPAAAAWKTGPLDEGFNPAQFEDIDYCYRLRSAGYRTVCLPAVEMYHFENVTTGGTESLNYRYITVKNGLRFKQKWEKRFASEGGRPDAEMPWRTDLPTVRLEDIGELPTTD